MPARPSAVLASLLALSAPAATQAKLKLVKDLAAHGLAATHAVFSADGKWLASASHDRTAKVWATEGWQHRQTLPGNKTQLWTVAFSPDGKRLALAGDAEVVVYGLRARKKPGKPLAKLRIAGEGMMPGSAFDVLFSRDGKRLFVGTFASRLDVWDTRRWKLVDQCGEHDGPDDGKMIEFLHVHPDGKTLLSGGRTFATRILRFGRIKKPKKKSRRKQKEKRKRGWTTVHRIPEKKRADGHPTHRMCGQFSADGKWMLLGGTDGILQVFRCRDWKEVKAVTAHPGQHCAALAFVDGARVVTASKTIKLWRTKDWTVVAEAKLGAAAQHMSVSPDGRHAVVACMDGHLRVFAILPGQ